MADGANTVESKHRPMNVKDVLQGEYQRLWGEARTFKRVEDYYAAVHDRDRDQAALCLSGGGVRSAAFALGVVQALARHRVLDRFHYLSTVSGGGYTGAWLSRWIAEAGHDVGTVMQALAPDPPEKPRAGEAASPVQGEPLQIAALRERSNFLTPRVGIASEDSWAAMALVARNLLLNWLIFVPALMLLALAFHLYRLALQTRWTEAEATGIGLVGAAALAYAVYRGCSKLPSHASARWAGREVFIHTALPALAWALLLPVAAAPFLVSGEAPGWLPPLVERLVQALSSGDATQRILWSLTWSVGLAALPPVLAGYGLAWLWAGEHRRHFTRNSVVWLVAALVSSAALAAGAYLMGRLLHTGTSTLWNWPLDVLAVFGPLWIVTCHLLLSAVFAGFRRTKEDHGVKSRLTPDLDREWLARLSALKLRAAVAWSLLGFACVILPPILFTHSGRAWATSVVGAAAGALAVFGGASPLAASGLVPTVRKWGRQSFGAMVNGATGVFVLMLFAGLGWIVGNLAAWIGGGEAEWHSQAAVDLLFAGYGAIAFVLAVLAFFVPRLLNVNRFSLHGLYRNRLARAFLGAARNGAGKQAAAGQHSRDPFTDFDPCDNLRMEKLWPNEKENTGRHALFPVINMTLNLSGSGRLAWQERKAEGFTVTPLTCGYGGLPHLVGESDESAAVSSSCNHRHAAEDGCYVRTAEYAGPDKDLSLDGAGITLATAMTISGAAVSPGMGYHTSPATAFLMTLFNLRLGAWLPSPKQGRPKELIRSGPKYALTPLIRELIGRMDAEGRDIYLSDGGHFENLGLYEMVRRRCRFIVVSDAGCDPGCAFADLGNAVRKILIDQRVRITFDTGLKIVRRGVGNGLVAHAVGKIEYPETDRPGWLLYVKPSYADELSVDIRAYAAANCAYPHETTADQWFSESQFESYRRLGEEIITRLVPPRRAGHTAEGSTLRAFFSELVPHGALPKTAWEAAAPARAAE